MNRRCNENSNVIAHLHKYIKPESGNVYYLCVIHSGYISTTISIQILARTIASDKNNIHSDVDISAWTVTIIHTQQYQ